MQLEILRETDSEEVSDDILKGLLAVFAEDRAAIPRKYPQKCVNSTRTETSMSFSVRTLDRAGVTFYADGF